MCLTVFIAFGNMWSILPLLVPMLPCIHWWIGWALQHAGLRGALSGFGRCWKFRKASQAKVTNATIGENECASLFIYVVGRSFARCIWNMCWFAAKQLLVQEYLINSNKLKIKSYVPMRVCVCICALVDWTGLLNWLGRIACWALSGFWKYLISLRSLS